MNADGGMGNTIWVMAALAVAAIILLSWRLWVLARKRRARVRDASCNARLQREREREEAAAWLERVRVDRDRRENEVLVSSVVVTPYPAALTPMPTVTAEQKFANVFNDCLSPDVEKARKARATTARAKLVKAKKKARRGKKK